MKKLLGLLMPFLFGGCLDVPEGITPIENFELEKYLGKWYEIARLDHSFERGLQQVTAEYAMRQDGGVSVTNRGYSTKQSEWKDAQGKAFFVDQPETGHLKVSFFGPFYGSYVIFELGDNYEYAFVSGSNTKYLWFLSKTPTVSQELKDHFLEKVNTLGFDKESLIFVDQK
ncbi:MAG: lipocalin [Candidatus Marinimicrobia bacterium]|jgi:apolipoprotein D and lipocalin family protein|nr:lipocalin [Candidatus Neomarinimicrobiota bacterium]MBT3575891.1 lipocalin [Candidatus Neomarinimicrobiota bacterium]MBT3679412.1 lipocalin [Candidatus Neomarinimicrobiota bacterium]MBT3951119.1 lipocalin [Candidatus Neomarinimicrobiota bacterium]MBT4254201.1 lipocalin [Candidatus Neomarinimicrobiota bacterium]